ncbi:recombinase family protein [Kitasatospora sp. NPDC004745]|uniref:recombinase family protein n=1 Tax=Kitasatospora sp. NPDC004745 TaxID=3364019 RepID=UPI003691BA40
MAPRMFGFEDSSFERLRASEVPGVQGAASRRRLRQSKAAIAEWMNSEGFRGTRGSDWTTMTVGRLLRTPEIAGLTRGDQGELVESGKPAMITPEEFHEIQAIDAEAAVEPREDTYEYLFTGGLAICGESGDPMASARSNADTPGYRCEVCGKTRIAAAVLEDYVGEHVLAELLRPGAQERIEAARVERAKQAVEVRAQVDQLKKAASELADSYLAGEVTRQTLVAVEKRAAEQIKPLRARLRFLEQVVNAPYLTDVDGAIKWWEHAPAASKRALVGLFVDAIEVNKASARGVRHIEPGRVVLRWRG